MHIVIPAGIDDPAEPSGGNIYDRRLCRGLTDAGWTVTEHPAAGHWPAADDVATVTTTKILAAIPDRSVVLFDGIIASAIPAVLAEHARRLRLVLLVHMIFGQPTTGRPQPSGSVRRAEASALAEAAAVITTSRWTRRRLIAGYRIPAHRVHVAAPGADQADLAMPTAGGGHLLCVGAVVPAKGHDVLFGALAGVAELPWVCRCVGSVERDREFVALLRRQLHADGLTDRVHWTGPRSGPALDRVFAGADALVLASHSETYGMVVTEALARGVPVVATAVGGVPEALGRGADGRRPGLLVPPGDPAAFAAALRLWLGDGATRERLRQTARQRRGMLSGWAATAERVARVLTSVAT